jgi:hypothetical protein
MNRAVINAIGKVRRNGFYLHIGPDGEANWLVFSRAKMPVEVQPFIWTPFSHN